MSEQNEQQDEHPAVFVHAGLAGAGGTAAEPEQDGEE